MKVKHIAAAYSILVGISMMGLWLMLWLTNDIPELVDEPVRITMHLAAEFSTAVLLITAGVTLLKKYKFAINLFQISMGMLIYTLIQSPGYYAEQGEIPFVAMFIILLIISIFLVILTLKSPTIQHKTIKNNP